VVDSRQALEFAKSKDLDLVEVAPGAKVPVCKVMDFNRYYYELKKKKKEEKKKSKSKQLKQIRMSPNIGKNDLKVKFNKIKNFLEKGHNVKVNMFFRGRQREHLEVGREILSGVIKELEGTASCESEPKFEGHSMSVLFRPENGNGK
jgi:translation initiation factor IF-3